MRVCLSDVNIRNTLPRKNELRAMAILSSGSVGINPSTGRYFIFKILRRIFSHAVLLLQYVAKRWGGGGGGGGGEYFWRCCTNCYQTGRG